MLWKLAKKIIIAQRNVWYFSPILMNVPDPTLGGRALKIDTSFTS